ncbi:hypothetical protein [Devosia sp. FKR38]|uniref:hypothetical protein n=1 Tax=Devosia sp. FKR38 TaxID=2562312 RepID=UPI0010C07E31|nr:hypothetical protein [Devosia sp. FKR38]
MSTNNPQKPRFYRVPKTSADSNAIAVRIFADRAGVVCVVSAPVPQWGLRVFTPTPISPDTALEALPYALFLMGFLNAERVEVQLDADVDWQADWGELVAADETAPAARP